MGLSIGRAVLTEDLRHLKATRGSHLPSGLRNRFGCSIEGTDDLGQVQPTDMEVDGGRCGRAVAQKQLDMMKARSRFDQVGGKAVPQGMHAGRFGDAGLFLGFVEEQLDRMSG